MQFPELIFGLRDWPLWERSSLPERVALIFIIAASAVVLGIALLRLVKRLSPDSRRYRAEVRRMADTLGHGFVQYLGHLDANDVFRTSHVNALLGDWRMRQDALSKIVDARMSSMRDVLATKESEIWTPEERSEFGYRYRTPLTVLFSLPKLEWMFQNAGLSFTSRGKRFYPELINLGHTSSGMTATFRCEPYITAKTWESALDVLGSALDSPGITVRETVGGQFTLSLNDVDIRNMEMKVLDEYRTQWLREESTRDGTSVAADRMSAKETQRKERLFGEVTKAESESRLIDLSGAALSGLVFTPSEATRVLSQLFDYETSAWIVRQISDGQLISGEYLWTAVETVSCADEESGRSEGVIRPRAGGIDLTEEDATPPDVDESEHDIPDDDLATEDKDVDKT
jgi:hypothetical protein